MTPTTIRAATIAAAEHVATLAERITEGDLGRPALGSWDVTGLAGHLLRALRTPLLYLAEPAPVGEPLPSAAAYYSAYRAWREADPEAADDRVAARGVAELGRASAVEIREAFATAAADLGAITAQPPDRLLASPFGTMHLDDYLRTRVLEMVVHGLDLAQALGADWNPPPVALADALHLCVEIALVCDSGPTLLLELTGREVVETALPVLR